MQKRAALARAMALDPEILFLDEPSAGLDPVSARLLDDLILELRDSLGLHDRRRHPRAGQHLRDRRQLRLPRRGEQTMTALDNPHRLLAESTDPAVRAFLSRRAQPGGAVASAASQASGTGRTT